MAKGVSNGKRKDGRERFRKPERLQLTLKIDPEVDRAFRWLADQYGKPFNETFEVLVRDAQARV
jgi:hypothetical protein